VCGGMTPEHVGECLPRINRESEVGEEDRFAAPVAVCEREQVVNNLLARHNRFVIIWQLHSSPFPSASALPMQYLMS